MHALKGLACRASVTPASCSGEALHAARLPRLRQCQSFQHTLMSQQSKSVGYSRLLRTLSRAYPRVPKFRTYGSVCCACAQRPGLPCQSFSRTLRSQKHNIFSMGPTLRYPAVLQSVPHAYHARLAAATSPHDARPHMQELIQCNQVH
jgi:hypothetical protein